MLCFSKMLLSRNFCQSRVRSNSRNLGKETCCILKTLAEPLIGRFHMKKKFHIFSEFFSEFWHFSPVFMWFLVFGPYYLMVTYWPLWRSCFDQKWSFGLYRIRLLTILKRTVHILGTVSKCVFYLLSHHPHHHGKVDNLCRSRQRDNIRNHHGEW